MQPDERTKLFLDLAKEVRESIKRDELGTRMKVTLPLFDGLVQTLENVLIRPDPNANEAVKLQPGELVTITASTFKPTKHRVVITNQGVMLINTDTYLPFNHDPLKCITRGELRKALDPYYVVTFHNEK